jgi:hypothetical protein
MSERRGRFDVRGFGQQIQSLGHELLGRIVRVQNVRGAKRKDNAIKKRLQPCRCLAVSQRRGMTIT